MLFLQCKWRSLDRTTVFSKREPSLKLAHVMLENAVGTLGTLFLLLFYVAALFVFFIFCKRSAQYFFSAQGTNCTLLNLGTFWFVPACC